MTGEKTEPAQGAPDKKAQAVRTGARSIGAISRYLFLTLGVVAIYLVLVVVRQQSEETDRSVRELARISTKLENTMETLQEIGRQNAGFVSDQSRNPGAYEKAIQDLYGFLKTLKDIRNRLEQLAEHQQTSSQPETIIDIRKTFDDLASDLSGLNDLQKKGTHPQASLCLVNGAVIFDTKPIYGRNRGKWGRADRNRANVTSILNEVLDACLIYRNVDATLRDVAAHIHSVSKTGTPPANVGQILLYIQQNFPQLEITDKTDGVLNKMLALTEAPTTLKTKSSEPETEGDSENPVEQLKKFQAFVQGGASWLKDLKISTPDKGDAPTSDPCTYADLIKNVFSPNSRIEVSKSLGKLVSTHKSIGRVCPSGDLAFVIEIPTDAILDAGDFETVLLADETGRVISSAGRTAGSIVSAAGWFGETEQENEAKKSNPNILGISSDAIAGKALSADQPSVANFRIAGRQLRVYARPFVTSACVIDANAKDITEKCEANTGKLFLLGLEPKSEFLQRTLAPPPILSLALILLIIIMLVATPFLKLILAAENGELLQRDLALGVASGLAMPGIFIILIFTWNESGLFEGRWIKSAALIADNMEHSVESELTDLVTTGAIEYLKTYNNSEEDASQTSSEESIFEPREFEGIRAKERSFRLYSHNGGHSNGYVTSDFLPRAIGISRYLNDPKFARRQPQFSRVRKGETYETDVDLFVSDKVTKKTHFVRTLAVDFAIGRFESGWQGLPVIDIAIDVEQLAAEYDNERHLDLFDSHDSRAPKIAALSARLTSLEFNPVIPNHIKFAVVDQKDGRVLWHSDTQRILTENFYLETGEDDRLAQLIRQRDETNSLSGRYRGDKVFYFLRPIENTDWSVVIMLNRTELYGHVVERMAYATMLYGIPVLLVLAMFMLAYLGRSHHVAWIWPRVGVGEDLTDKRRWRYVYSLNFFATLFALSGGALLALLLPVPWAAWCFVGLMGFGVLISAFLTQSRYNLLDDIIFVRNKSRLCIWRFSWRTLITFVYLLTFLWFAVSVFRTPLLANWFWLAIAFLFLIAAGILVIFSIVAASSKGLGRPPAFLTLFLQLFSKTESAYVLAFTTAVLAATAPAAIVSYRDASGAQKSRAFMEHVSSMLHQTAQRDSLLLEELRVTQPDLFGANSVEGQRYDNAIVDDCLDDEVDGTRYIVNQTQGNGYRVPYGRYDVPWRFSDLKTEKDQCKKSDPADGDSGALHLPYKILSPVKRNEIKEEADHKKSLTHSLSADVLEGCGPGALLMLQSPVWSDANSRHDAIAWSAASEQFNPPYCWIDAKKALHAMLDQGSAHYSLNAAFNPAHSLTGIGNKPGASFLTLLLCGIFIIFYVSVVRLISSRVFGANLFDRAHHSTEHHALPSHPEIIFIVTPSPLLAERHIKKSLSPTDMTFEVTAHSDVDGWKAIDKANFYLDFRCDNKALPAIFPGHAGRIQTALLGITDKHTPKRLFVHVNHPRIIDDIFSLSAIDGIESDARRLSVSKVMEYFRSHSRTEYADAELLWRKPLRVWRDLSSIKMKFEDCEDYAHDRGVVSSDWAFVDSILHQDSAEDTTETNTPKNRRAFEEIQWPELAYAVSSAGQKLESPAHSNSLDVNDLISRALETGSLFYQNIWGSLDKEEHLALYVFARGDLVNWQNRSVLRRLMKLGLLRRTPRARLVNESFGLFVLGRARDDGLNSRLKTIEQSAPWHAVRNPYIITILVILVGLALVGGDEVQAAAAAIASLQALLAALGRFSGGRVG